jgi:hypothetical protein
MNLAIFLGGVILMLVAVIIHLCDYPTNRRQRIRGFLFYLGCISVLLAIYLSVGSK